MKLIRESLNEEIMSKKVNIRKLKEYAEAIAIICNGEYGDVYFNKLTEEIFVCLGDSNPFEGIDLEMFIKDAVAIKYGDYANINVTIEKECTPNTDEKGWKKIN
jgi:hypothetical protein